MSKLRGRRPFVFRLRTSLALGLALASIEAAAYEYPVRIIREDKGSAVQLSIANDGLVPVTVVIELTSSSNTGFSPAVIGSKFPHLVFPGQTRRITTAVPLKIGRDARFAYQYRFAFGDPQARHRSDQLYRLPIPDGGCSHRPKPCRMPIDSVTTRPPQISTCAIESLGLEEVFIVFPE